MHQGFIKGCTGSEIYQGFRSTLASHQIRVYGMDSMIVQLLKRITKCLNVKVCRDVPGSRKLLGLVPTLRLWDKPSDCSSVSHSSGHLAPLNLVYSLVDQSNDTNNNIHSIIYSPPIQKSSM